jgi:hypothetical protein
LDWPFFQQLSSAQAIILVAAGKNDLRTDYTEITLVIISARNAINTILKHDEKSGTLNPKS